MSSRTSQINDGQARCGPVNSIQGAFYVQKSSVGGVKDEISNLDGEFHEYEPGLEAILQDLVDVG